VMTSSKHSDALLNLNADSMVYSSKNQEIAKKLMFFKQFQGMYSLVICTKVTVHLKLQVRLPIRMHSVTLLCQYLENSD
jgi:hypothetical protein